MKNSLILGYAVSMWHWLVGCYEKSLAAKIINGFCGFFIKRADGSFFVRIFRHGFCTGSWWKNSLIYRNMCKFLRGGVLKPARSGAILNTVLGLYAVPLWKIGAALLCAAVPMAASGAVLGQGRINMLCPAALAVLAVVCLLLNKSPAALCRGSAILRLVCGFFGGTDWQIPNEPAGSLRLWCAGAAIFGTLAGAAGPALSIVAAVGIIFVFAVLARYEIGLYLLLFIAAFVPTSVCAALAVMTAAGFLYALCTGRVKNLRPTVMAPIIAMYILFGIFSTATSFHITKSAFIFIVYLMFIAMYAVTVYTLDTKAKWRAAVTLFAASAIFVAAYGIFQNFTMDATTQSWVDTQMFEDIKIRVYASFDNPNVLGQYFIVTVPIIVALFANEKSISRKMCWGLSAVLCFLCLIYTWSRGAWVGVMFGVVIFLLLSDRRWLMLCILGLFTLPFILPPSILNRILSLGNTGDSSTAYRVSVWIASARMAAHFWMSGVGFGSDAFAAAYANYALNGAGFALHSHNFYIQLVADVGIGGLICYVLLVLTSLREISSVKPGGMIKCVTVALAGALAGYCFQGIAESLWFNMRMSLMFWTVTAFAVSGARLTDRSMI